MKVILLKDIPRVGQKYDTKEVSNGYGRNFLLPRGLAEISTEKSMAKISTLRARHEGEKKLKEDLLLKNIEDLNGVTITVTEKANEKGHLFSGVHKEKIIQAIKEQTHLDIDSEHIILEHPIKEVGEHEVDVKVGNVDVKFKLVIDKLKEGK